VAKKPIGVSLPTPGDLTHQPWTIRPGKPGEMDRDDLGECEETTREILHLKGQHRRARASTCVHESIHAMMPWLDEEWVKVYEQGFMNLLDALGVKW
jgi:hypothetical protein